MAARERWREHVERSASRGLTATQYGAQTGLKAGSLRVWKWRLRRENPGGSAQATVASFVELRVPEDARMELELPGGRRQRIPSSFDASALRRLIKLLEGAS
jgi:hypothetical protein